MPSIFQSNPNSAPVAPVVTYTTEQKDAMVLSRLITDLKSFNKLATECLSRIMSANENLLTQFGDSPNSENLFGYTNEQKLALFSQEDVQELFRRKELLTQALEQLNEATSYAE